MEKDTNCRPGGMNLWNSQHYDFIYLWYNTWGPLSHLFNGSIYSKYILEPHWLSRNGNRTFTFYNLVIMLIKWFNWNDMLCVVLPTEDKYMTWPTCGENTYPCYSEQFFMFKSIILDYSIPCIVSCILSTNK